MATSDNWGQGSKNNDNGWGKGASNNSNGWGSIHANTYGHPTTNLTGEGGFVGLLDLYPNAAFATGMRLLRADYSGGLLRIIAYDGASQQGAADIMPYKIGDNYWVDFNSKLENLDVTATGRGLTTNDTLADLCSVGVNNYDGLIPSWYDQSLNANHATQTSLAAMPKLVDAGVLVEENGKPAMQFDGVDDELNFSEIVSLEASLFYTGNFDETNTYGGIIVGNSGKFIVHTQIGGYSYRTDDYNPLVNHGLAPLTQNQVTMIIDATTGSGWNNGIAGNQNVVLSSNPGYNFTTLGGGFAGRNFKGTMQEVVLYSVKQLANRESIESNINNAYNIY